MMHEDYKIQLFENKAIRTAWDEEAQQRLGKPGKLWRPGRECRSLPPRMR